MALLKNCLFASVALTLIVSACANKDLSVHRNVVCKTYRAPNSVYTIQSSESMTAVPAVAMVSDKFNVLDIAVGVNITHPNVGALKISLEAREPCSVHNNMLTQGNAASKVSCVDAETRQTRLLANYGGCVLLFLHLCLSFGGWGFRWRQFAKRRVVSVLCVRMGGCARKIKDID